MRLMIALLLFLSAPALAQTTLTVTPGLATTAELAAVDTKAQQALDGTTVLGSNQTAIQADLADLLARVTALEAAPSNWPTHGMFYMNALPQGAGNACTMALTEGTVACPPDVTDWEGDETDVAINCTSGSHDGEIYTAAEVGDHKCHFMASDPRWNHATHNSVVLITVNP